MNLSKILMVGCLFLPSLAIAEWYDSRGEYYFGVETSEKVACKAAEDLAVLDVLRRTKGESISVSQFQTCDDSSADVCRMLSSVIMYTEGTVTGLNRVHQEVTTLPGKKVCTVLAKVKIQKEKGFADVSFDPEIKMVQTRLRDGEAITYIVKPTSAMYLNLFVYSPHTEDIQLIYPNRYDSSKKFIQNTKIPTKNSYRINAEFPKISGNLAGEMVIAVATKKEITFREKFTFTEFNQRLLEIPRNERRVVRIPYFIMAPN
jgi:hypothetical protein